MTSGENLYLNIEPKNLRVSRDWVGDHWLDVEPNPNILSIISDTKLSTTSAASKEAKSDDSPIYHKIINSHKLSAVEEEEEIHDLEGMTLTNVPLEDGCNANEQQRVFEAEEKEHYAHEEEKDNADYDSTRANVDVDGNGYDDGDDGDKERNVDEANEESNLVDCEISELKSEAETMEMLTEC